MIFSSTGFFSSFVNTSDSNAIGYVDGLSAASWNNNKTNGALYKQVYNNKWVHEIFGDYVTGQLAVRGKKNGVWTDWRILLDSVNYTDYITSVKDAGNKKEITFSYSKSALEDTDYNYLAAWNGYELRTVPKDNFSAKGLGALCVISKNNNTSSGGTIVTFTCSIVARGTGSVTMYAQCPIRLTICGGYTTGTSSFSYGIYQLVSWSPSGHQWLSMDGTSPVSLSGITLKDNSTATATGQTTRTITITVTLNSNSFASLEYDPAYCTVS